MSKKSIYRAALAIVIFLSVYCFSFVNTHPKAKALRLQVLPQQEMKGEIADEEQENKNFQVPDTTLLKRAMDLLEKFIG